MRRHALQGDDGALIQAGHYGVEGELVARLFVGRAAHDGGFVLMGGEVDVDFEQEAV